MVAVMTVMSMVPGVTVMTVVVLMSMPDAHMTVAKADAEAAMVPTMSTTGLRLVQIYDQQQSRSHTSGDKSR